MMYNEKLTPMLSLLCTSCTDLNNNTIEEKMMYNEK